MNLHGTIRHRVLVNYRADPDVVTGLLPDGMRPQLVGESAVVGMCLLRLEHLRPHGLTRALGFSCDAAAHRIAVERDTPRGTEAGVFVARRDTAQRLPVLVGGRLFPGVHGRAHFAVQSDGDRLQVRYRTRDAVDVEVDVQPITSWHSELFDAATQASTFFEAGSCGWSFDHRGELEGVRMTCNVWSAEPVDVVESRSSWLDDPLRFPAGSITLDSALLMRDLPVSWASL